MIHDSNVGATDSDKAVLLLDLRSVLHLLLYDTSMSYLFDSLVSGIGRVVLVS